MKHDQMYDPSSVDPGLYDKMFQYITRNAMGAESIQDQEFQDPELGPILQDRETGDPYRLKVVNGNLEIEEAE